jgi:UDP-N-acetylglucosamine diphosphorylase / glucose-1-phosphate thymidylyltransferase / UDP-N-acetylgalactosamine diphosphorylase / glucosamine-1-phosphate N-acetyltransferase / galactosamine-1-phosphate N-acetyltransferase
MHTDLIGVIPAAGRGIRMLPHTERDQKASLQVDGVSILERNIGIMRNQLGIKSIYVLVGHKKQQIMGQLEDGAKFGAQITYIEVKDINKGLAQGILQLESRLKTVFCVILGDELYLDSNHQEMLDLLNNDFDAVCAIKEVRHLGSIKKNYSVRMQNGLIISLVEKPEIVENNYMGCGTYFFKPGIFDYIKKTPVSPRTGRIELTEVINALAAGGGRVLPFILRGNYINVNSRGDYSAAKYMARSANFSKKTVTLIIPAYNEESSIGYVLDDFKDKVDEILVVNNNSADKTEEVARAGGARVLTGSFKGYGAALKFGMDNAKGEILILTEADGSFVSRDLGKILEYLKDADMVLGTRTTKQMIEQAANMNFLMRWGNICMAKIIELLWLYKNEPRLTDVGCTYRGIWKSDYNVIRKSLHCCGPAFSPEMIIEAMRYNKRIIEIPVTYSGRIAGESKFSSSIFFSAKTAWQMFCLIVRKKILDLLGRYE